MYRIIFFDIDGTLRDEVYGIPGSIKTVIDSCKSNGLYLCLCTGRTIGTIPDDVLDLEMDGIIAGGGSHIEFHNKILSKSFFKAKKINQANFYLSNKDKKIAFTFETDNTVFMNKGAVGILNSLNDKKFNLLNEKSKKEYLEKQKIIYEENIKKFNGDIHKVNKICLWGSEEIFKELENIFEEDIQLAQSYNFGSQNYYEIIQKNCNKGEAIIKLCEGLNISMNEAIAFGDGKNDINMLKVVGTAVAVESGDKEIFKYVNSICEEPTKDGIYLELKRRKVI